MDFDFLKNNANFAGISPEEQRKADQILMLMRTMKKR